MCGEREERCNEKKKPRVMMKKRKGDEKRGQMKKKDEKPKKNKLDTFSETCKSCGHGKCGGRRVGAHERSSASATVCPPAAGRRAAKEVLHGCACVDPWRI